ncbi:MAG: endonuclease V [Candidatus Aminicenantes bacterium]|nr:endonuclease V [Candidatus Aminicenantes bacterium]HHF52033.1 endonuclease V [Candidatus Aminicenantes bacterium]
MFDFKKAVKAQLMLSRKLDLFWDRKEVKKIAGADCSYDYKNKKVGAKVVVIELSDLKIIETSEGVADFAIPYVPGFLNFREAPALIKAFKGLNTEPDISLIDGNGIAHPRSMGIASYLGVVLGIATIGCAKSPFYPFTYPDNERGAYTHYKNRKDKHVGYCVRTRTGVKPIFVSPGHRVNFTVSLDIVLRCSKYRIPEPIRYAHRLAGELFKSQ